MANEIEDKFLVTNNTWRDLVTESTHITQTYVFSRRWMTIRTRLETGRPAILCVKLKSTKEGTPEYEYRMPKFLARAATLWRTRTIKKIRHHIPWESLIFEVDEFQGRLAPLVMAEVEKPSVDFPYQKPTWFGRDVSHDPRFKNAMLVRHGLPENIS